MKKFFLFLFAFSAIGLLQAQSLKPSVIASAGGNYSGASLQVSWTLGETFTQTLVNGNAMLTQGFQQPAVVACTAPVTPSVTGTNAICTGGNTSFTATAASGILATTTYSWTGPNGFTASTAAIPNLTVAGTYTCTISNGSGCSVSVSRILTANAAPTATITPATSTSFCTGGSVVLNANTGTGLTYVWRLNGTAITGATSASYTASAAGSYSVTVTNASACSATSLATVVTVNTPPTANITAATSTSFCTGGSVVLNANTGTGLTYVWRLNGAAISGATSASYTASTAGSYSVTVTKAGNCSATSPSTVVTVNTPPSATVSASGTLNICTGGSVTLSTPAVSGQTYVWRNNGTAITGATSNSYTASAAGSYSVTVTSAAGCATTSSSSVVTLNAIPATPSTLTGPTMICTLTSGTYTASTVTGAVSYSWTLPSGLTGTSTTNSIAVAINDLAFTSGAVTVKANTAFCTSAAKSLTIAKVPATPSSLTGSPTVTCGITTGSYTSSTSIGATYYSWTLPTGYSGTSATNSINTSINNSVFTSGSITVKAGNICGISGAKSLSVSKVPFVPSSISGPTITCGLTTATYTAATGSNVSSYTWTLPAGITGTSTTNVITVSIDNSVFVSGSITAKANNACGSSAAKSLTLSKAPFTPTTITGPAQICGLTTATYTCTAMTGATSYNWVLPAGLTGTSTTNSITVAVNPSLYTSGSVSVQAVNSCASSGAKTLALTKVLAAVTTLSGPASICGLTSATYTATAVTGATGYAWVLPSGLTGTSSTNTITVAVNPASFTTGSVSVAAVNACGTGAAKTLALSKIPSTPTTITGPAAAVCASSTQTYSCTAMANATSYTWAVPAGAVINSGQGTNSVSVTFPATFASGTVSVTANSVCGSSTAKSLSIASTTAQPGTITGTTTNLCAGGSFTYSIAAVTGATSYTWTAPAGCSFSGSSTGTSVSLVVPAGFVSGTLSVVANNACGASVSRTLALLGAPATPASITGPASVCPSASGLIFSTPAVTGATSYAWTVPTGASITAGTGTSSIIVKWGTIAGSVSVKSVNACGTNATARTYAVALAACRLGEEPTEEASVLVYPNPGKDIFHVRTAGLEGSHLRVTDMLGREILRTEIQMNETQVELSRMPSATYFFRIEGNNFNKVVKVVKR